MTTPLTPERTCKRCGKPIPPPLPGRTPKRFYCSRLCQQAVAAADHRARNPIPPRAEPRRTHYVREPEERFWSLVDRSDPDGCWPWTGSISTSGYGQFRATAGGAGKRGGPTAAHRYAYQITNGVKLKSSEALMHSCDNRRCVRPDHLSIGTQAENMADMVSKARRIAELEAELAECRERRERVDPDLRAVRKALLLALPATDGQGRLMVDVVDAALAAVRKVTA